MGRSKNILALLVVVCIIAACGALPLMVFALRDGRTMGRANYETAPAVELEIREDQHIPAMGKLALMYRMDGGIQISESMASMTREEVEARSLLILQTYIDAGLVTAFEPHFLEVWCFIGQAMEDPSLNAIYWMVTIVSADEQNFAQFDLALDDENGDLLSVSFASEEVIASLEWETRLSVFAAVYFSSLGIQDHEAFSSSALEVPYVGENAFAVRYTFGDVQYGEINVDLYVYQHGFYTEFPDLREGNQ